MSIEDLGVRLRADGVVEASNGVNLTGKAIEDLGRKADAAAPAMARTGNTAKQTAAAMRLLPAQITDITTSLASGQPAWLVAIQQGGQIKDSFGGIGPAATALRAAITPLAFAIGGAAVATGVLAAAFVAAARESHAMERAIVLSGNAAGVTTDEIHDMAAALGGMVGTQRQAADALTQLVASGQVGQRGMQQFAETAVRMERVTGQSVEDTVKVFADLARAPLQTSIRLNESFNYLTIATYNHIRALVEQKKMTEAAEVAQRTFSDAVNPRLKQLEENVDNVTWAYRGLKSVISEAANAVIGVFRDETVSQKIKDIQGRLADMGDKPFSGVFGGVDPRIQLRAELAALQDIQKAQQAAAAPRAAEAAAVKEEIAAADERARAIKAATAAYANLFQEVAQHAALTRAELDQGRKLTEAESYRAKGLAALAAVQKEHGSSQAAQYRAALELEVRQTALLEKQREAAKLQEEADKAFVTSQQQAAELVRSRAEVAEREAEQVRQGNVALADQTAELGLNTKAHYERAQAKNAEKIAEAEAQLKLIEGLAVYEREENALKNSIAWLKERTTLLSTNYAKTNAVEELRINKERTDAIAASIEEGVINGFRDGRKASAAFLREIQAQFLRAALKLPIQMLAQAGNDVMGGLLKLVGGFFGAAGGSPNGAQGGDYGVFFHGGGVGAGEAAFSRRMPAATWRGAPRFHGGMGPGELPAVIKNDEGVFTKGQMKALAPVSALAAAAPVVNQYTTINIDSRTDRAEVVQLVARGMQAAQANLLDKLNRKQV